MKLRNLKFFFKQKSTSSMPLQLHSTKKLLTKYQKKKLFVNKKFLKLVKAYSKNRNINSAWLPLSLVNKIFVKIIFWILYYKIRFKKVIKMFLNFNIKIPPKVRSGGGAFFLNNKNLNSAKLVFFLFDLYFTSKLKFTLLKRKVLRHPDFLLPRNRIIRKPYFKYFSNTNLNKLSLKKLYRAQTFLKKKNILNFLGVNWVIVLTTTNNNMFVNITNLLGETIFFHTLRRLGFQTGGSSKRSSKVAVERLGLFVGKFLKKKRFDFKKFLIVFKGISWKKRFIVKHIKNVAKTIKIVSIFERSLLAHNGCKKNKRKHKRRSFLKLNWLKRKLRIRKFKKIFKPNYGQKLFFKFNNFSSIFKVKTSFNLKFFTIPKFFGNQIFVKRKRYFINKRFLQ